jgi:hypothetical protein
MCFAEAIARASDYHHLAFEFAHCHVSPAFRVAV